MNIVLMGYRCTGKTSAGLSLAGLLDRPFFDTDEMIRRRTGRTVEEIVAAGGWEAFREAERAVIGELALSDGSVIALGGGAIVDTRNVAALRGKALFVWLAADAGVIAARLEKDPVSGAQRPSLTGRPMVLEVTEVLTEREPLYGRIADLTIDTNARTAGEVADLILDALRERITKNEPLTEPQKGSCLNCRRED